MSESTAPFNVDKLERFIERYMELEEDLQRPKGIYSVLPGSRERKYQYTLKYFLDSQQPHGFGYELLEEFLNVVGFRDINLRKHHIKIEDEVATSDKGSDRRIDLVICGGSSLEGYPDWGIFLELKVGASEGNDQTHSYARADKWDLDWFGSNEIDVNKLDEKYLYVKKAQREPSQSSDFHDIS